MHYFLAQLSSIKFHLQIKEKFVLKLVCAIILISMDIPPTDSRVTYLPKKLPQNTQTGFMPVNQGGMFQNPNLRGPAYLPRYNQDTSQYGESEQIGLSNHHLRPFSTPQKPVMIILLFDQ